MARKAQKMQRAKGISAGQVLGPSVDKIARARAPMVWSGLVGARACPKPKGNMEGQLIAGQWVEVSMQDLPTPLQLSAFVLSLRPSEVLLTFPELLSPPQGLESEARATLRYSNTAGHYTAIGHILRVASGPPVTVTFKRLMPVEIGARETSIRRGLIRTPVDLPVAVHVVRSRVSPAQEPAGAPGRAENISSSGMLLQTSLLLSVGDTVRLVVTKDHDTIEVHGRVTRVFESEDGGSGRFGIGIEFVHVDENERERWLQFTIGFR
jgi:hypothetical protein